jgi:hypothetical protein
VGVCVNRMGRSIVLLRYSLLCERLPHHPSSPLKLMALTSAAMLRQIRAALV